MRCTYIHNLLGGPACAGILLAVMQAAIPVYAQDAQGQAGGGNAPAAAQPEKPQQLPPLSQEIMEPLGRAQACLVPEEEMEPDFECAHENLDRVNRVRNPNNHEKAQIWNFAAYLAFEEDDSESAIERFEDIKTLPLEEIPKGLALGAYRNVASLYAEKEDYPMALEAYLDWMNLPFVNPAPAEYFFLSQLYYLVDDLENGLVAVNQAISLSQAQGSLGAENWWSMRFFFQRELELEDDAFETLIVLVENWTKKNWVIALVGLFQERERHQDSTALYEAAYEAGWLERGNERVQLASFYLNQDTPYKAAVILDAGLSDGTIESTQQNWRMLAQAWQMAREDEKALPALRRASELSEDGEIDSRLATSLARLGRYQDCADAARSALERGDLDRPDYVNMQLGRCLAFLRKFTEARSAFQEAAKDDRQKDTAASMLEWVAGELEQNRRNEEILRKAGRIP